MKVYERKLGRYLELSMMILFECPYRLQKCNSGLKAFKSITSRYEIEHYCQRNQRTEKSMPKVCPLFCKFRYMFDNKAQQLDEPSQFRKFEWRKLSVFLLYTENKVFTEAIFGIFITDQTKFNFD